MNLFSTQFQVNVDTAPAEFHMEMTHLCCDTDLRNTFRNVRFIDVYSFVYLLIIFQCLTTMRGE
jgi:hypothetical protein